LENALSLIYLPSTGATDWQRLLADPRKQWRSGFSAKTLAHCWEAAGGLPPEIASILRSIGGEPELLIALPEHKVPLPGGARGESQNDLFALVRVGERTLAATIEGKVDEPFGSSLGAWKANASAGKHQRLAFLCDRLGLDEQQLPPDLPYQLLHRTVSALIEADRFKTDATAMIVHSFSPHRRWFDAFAHFVSLFGCVAEPGRLALVRPDATRPLYVGWACGNPLYLAGDEADRQMPNLNHFRLATSG
jgi:hypothetical protein